MVSLKTLWCSEFWEGQSGIVICGCERPCTVWEQGGLTSPVKCRLRKCVWENSASSGATTRREAAVKIGFLARFPSIQREWVSALCGP